MNRPPEPKHMVQVLHKMAPATGDEPRTLAVGQTFKFNSGDAYTVKPDGSVRRANPGPYCSKAHRKVMKKIKRLARKGWPVQSALCTQTVEAK